MFAKYFPAGEKCTQECWLSDCADAGSDWPNCALKLFYYMNTEKSSPNPTQLKWSEWAIIQICHIPKNIWYTYSAGGPKHGKVMLKFRILPLFFLRFVTLEGCQQNEGSLLYWMVYLPHFCWKPFNISTFALQLCRYFHAHQRVFRVASLNVEMRWIFG